MVEKIPIDTEEIHSEWLRVMEIKDNYEPFKKRIESVIENLEIYDIFSRIFPDHQVQTNLSTLRPKVETDGQPDHRITGYGFYPINYELFIEQSQSVFNMTSEELESRTKRTGLRFIIEDPLKEPRSVNIHIGNLDSQQGVIIKKYKAKETQELIKIIEENLKSPHPLQT